MKKKCIDETRWLIKPSSNKIIRRSASAFKSNSNQPEKNKWLQRRYHTHIDFRKSQKSMFLGSKHTPWDKKD